VKRLSIAVFALVLAPMVALGQSGTGSTETLAVAEHSAQVAQTPPGGSTSATSAANASGSSAQPAATATATAPAQKKSALANAVQARTPEEQARQSGFQFLVQLDHYLGTGTFVDASKYAYLGSFLTVVPRYLFAIGNRRLVASVTARMAYEYTMPDVETGRKASFFDTRVSLASPALFREKWLTGIAFTPNVSLTIPTSPESWNAGMITSISAGVTMSRQVKMFDLIGSIGGARSFYTSAQSGVRASSARDENGNLYVVCRAGEPVCGFSNMNPAWSFNVSLNVQWRVTGDLMVYAGYTYLKTWRYAATYTVDEYTPRAVDSNGKPVATVGFGSVDRTLTFVGASYQLNEHYSLDLGVQTGQTPLHPNGQVRFPFLSIGAWASNSTSLYFTFTAAY
jgi:hypothetical protein